MLMCVCVCKRYTINSIVQPIDVNIYMCKQYTIDSTVQPIDVNKYVQAVYNW